MNLFALFIVVALVVAQLSLPRRLVLLPLLFAVSNLPNVVVMDVGVYSFTPIRLLLLAGVFRAWRDRSLTWSRHEPLDVLIAIWTILTLLTALGHRDHPSTSITFRLGQIYNVLGTYLVARAYIRNTGDLIPLAKCWVFVLLPLALAMAYEAQTRDSIYSILGYAREQSWIRGDRVRAMGPFGHSIMAGTAGASTVPILMLLWHTKHRWRWLIPGMAACLTITIASVSSGPIASLATGIAALGMWKIRGTVRSLKVAAILGLVLFHFLVEQPIWLYLSEVDLVGGSTGDHRAKLIDASVRNLDEWWLTGTDFTAHWVKPTAKDPTQSDMTCHYLRIGVLGGLPLLLVFVWILLKAFQQLRRGLTTLRWKKDTREFELWCVGSALFVHAVTMIATSYLGQVFLFPFLILGAIPGIVAHLDNRTSNVLPLDENPARQRIHRRPTLRSGTAIP